MLSYFRTYQEIFSKVLAIFYIDSILIQVDGLRKILGPKKKLGLDEIDGYQ
jgi:hypothetical protein